MKEAVRKDFLLVFKMVLIGKLSVQYFDQLW